MREVDLIIEPTWLIEVEPEVVAREGWAVAVADGAVAAVGPVAEIDAGHAAREREVLRGHALTPGFVNAHVHNPMTLLRGFADDLTLMTWLRDHIWPAEGRFVGEGFVRSGTELAVLEMLRGGTTTCNENYFFPDVLAATYRDLGFRAVVGLPVLEFPTAWAASADEYFEKGLRVLDEFAGDRWIGLAMAPHAPFTVSDASFVRARELAERFDLVVHTHLHESKSEVEEAVRESGARPIERLRRLGLVDDRLLAVHMTQLTDAEIELVAERGVTVVHCPESNLKLAGGFCPTEALRRSGARLALGTDGPASNNDLDMFGEMRLAALLAKGVTLDAEAMPAAAVLRMATLGGARALRIDDAVGSIALGKRADLVAVDLSQPETVPVYDPVSQLVYSAGRGLVREVWLDGRRRVRAGQLVDLDVEGILARADEWRARISP